MDRHLQHDSVRVVSIFRTRPPLTKRLTGAERRDDSGQTRVEWSQVLHEIDERFRAIGRLSAVLSPHLTVEEAYLLAKYARGVDSQALIVLGHVPVVGQDETFKNGFTIRADKCPNRRGVEEIVRHFTGRVATFAELLSGGEIEKRAMWTSGGYKSDWIDEKTAESLARAQCLVVQDLFGSPLAERADYLLPGAAFAEREGSYVNHADRLQSVPWAIRPPPGVRVEAGVFWELLGLPGMVKARGVLDEVAREIAFFAAAGKSIGPLGIDLKAPAPAQTATTG
ncbi:MAG: molybdopterin-dependent oxidoreductase [Planctomycetes bacterium]|nr:molybdopterin-dependent oxidoreductase [Planctomycetota bacterium]